MATHLLTHATSGRIRQVVAPLSFLVILGIFLSTQTPNFLTWENLRTVAIQTVSVAILAIGETAVIISGGIDLSVGAVLALSGVTAVYAMEHGASALVGVLVGLLTGAVCGAFNGLVTTRLRMPAFVVTLGMLGMASGAALLISGGVSLTGIAPGFERLGRDWSLGVLAVVAVGFHLLLSYTRLGRYCYAIGGNPEAARLSGVSLVWYQTSYFVLCGLCAGLAGVLQASRATVAQPTAGKGWELDAIAAAVIGGTSLMGGQGSIIGTLLGAFLMAIIRNGCNLLNVEVEWQQVFIGAMVIVAVFYDRWQRGRR
ncbi:MAG: ABC transporter permease [Chthonomonadetes bacterium]|nr:ABC transporter permease [Chthonomonadetes bacterium]